MLEHTVGRGRHRSENGIAPASLVMKDLSLLRSRDLLRTTREVEEIIFIQSLEGRAHIGRGAFAGGRFINTTEDDLIHALHLHPPAIRRKRQTFITEIVEWVERAIGGAAGPMLLTPDLRPLLGVGTFSFMQVDPAEVLRGLYLGGMRDALEVREAAAKQYGITVGSGRLYPVDFAVMHRTGLTGESLARGVHAANIEEFKKVGLITQRLPSSEGSVRYMYIRHDAGPGLSDDAAIVAAGLRHGLGAAVGVFLADAIDTLEKYVPTGQEGDQDLELAKMIEREWPDLLLGPQDLCELVFLSISGEGVPDSSLRHLLRVDRLVDQCPLEAHLLKVAGRPFASLELGHRRLLNDDLYEQVEGQIERLKTAPDPQSRTHH